MGENRKINRTRRRKKNGNNRDEKMNRSRPKQEDHD